jgi:hypothetical protein
MRLTTAEQEQRIKWSVADWKRMVFVTATLEEECHNPRVISLRWTEFIKGLKREGFSELQCVRVLQEHEGGHGWHVHALIDRFIPLSVSKPLEKKCGLGRSRWDWVSEDDREKRIGYMVRYVCRDMKRRRKNPALKNVRLLTASGSLSGKKRWWKRYCDLIVQDSGEEFRAALQRRLELVNAGQIVFRTHRGRSIPLRMTELLKVATRSDIEWAHGVLRRRVTTAA